MNQAQIQQFLGLLGETQTKTERGWVTTHCPLAPWTHQSGKDTHPSFSIKVEDMGRSFYNCWACGGGSLDDLLVKIQWHCKSIGAYPPVGLATAYAMLDEEQLVGLSPLPEEWTPPQVNPQPKLFQAWPEWWLDTFVHVRKVEYGMTYLQERNVSEEIINLLDIRYDTMRHAVCFPIRNRSGFLAGMRGRYVVPLINSEGEKKRYHDYDWKGANNSWLVFLNENNLNMAVPVVLVEGPFDLASVLRVWKNTASALTVAMSDHKILRMVYATKVISFFDPNKGGEHATEKVHRVLWGQTQVESVTYPEGFTVDPGAMTEDQVRDLLAEHVPV